MSSSEKELPTASVVGKALKATIRYSVKMAESTKELQAKA